MNKGHKLFQVGAQDPEQKNSAIMDNLESDILSADAGPEAGYCYFNDKAFPTGEYVCSGNELLRCEEGGYWVIEGDCIEP